MEGSALKWMRGNLDLNISGILAAVADAGYPVLSPNLAGNAFGNDTALSRMDDAKNYLQTAMGAKAGKVILMGGSMGGGTCMAWARAHLASVACMVLYIPLSDMQDIKDNNRAGLAATLDGAYPGGWSNAVHGAAHNPLVFASQLAGIPIQLWYATDDTIVIPSTVQALIAAIGGSNLEVHTVVGGHADTSAGNIPATQVVSFIQAHT